MPYTVGNGAILEVSIRGKFLDQTFISLFHYRYERGAGEIDGRTLINTINPLINGAGAGKLVNEYSLVLANVASLEQVVYQWLFPTRRPRVVKTPAVVGGGQVADPSPPNIAMALTKRGDLAGRHGVGTLHMPAIVNESWVGGKFTIAGRDLYGALQTAVGSVVNIEFGENLVPVIFNRVSPADSPQITEVTNNEEVRTMHRRTVGLGI